MLYTFNRWGRHWGGPPNHNSECPVKRSWMKSTMGFKIAVDNPLDSSHWRPRFKVSTSKISVFRERNFSVWVWDTWARNAYVTTMSISGIHCYLCGLCSWFVDLWGLSIALRVRKRAERYDTKSLRLLCCTIRTVSGTLSHNVRVLRSIQSHCTVACYRITQSLNLATLMEWTRHVW